MPRRGPSYQESCRLPHRRARDSARRFAPPQRPRLRDDRAVPPPKAGGIPLVRPDVLVQPEEIRWVVPALQRLELRVAIPAVRLLDPLLALLHEEVHVDIGLVRQQRVPETARPLALLREAGLIRGRRIDVDRVPRAAAAEGCLVLAHARDRAAQLEDRERGEG